MRGQPLFDKIVELCGVSAVLAPGLVRRALADGKVTIEEATAADYRVALPKLLARLRAYMPEEDAQRRSRRIGALLQAIESGGVEGEVEESLIGRVTDALRTPAAGTPRPGSAAGAPTSGEVGLPDYDADEHTLVGRRYTAHEREVIRQTGVAPREASSPEIELPRDGSGEDFRKTRR